MKTKLERYAGRLMIPDESDVVGGLAIAGLVIFDFIQRAVLANVVTIESQSPLMIKEKDVASVKFNFSASDRFLRFEKTEGGLLRQVKPFYGPVEIGKNAESNPAYFSADVQFQTKSKPGSIIGISIDLEPRKPELNIDVTIDVSRFDYGFAWLNKAQDFHDND